MSIDSLLSRLDKVKETGARRWIGRCPAHDDRSPSLAIRELDDGRVLIHDFAGCDTESVLSAIGLTFGALFETPPDHHYRRERRPFNANEALQCMAFEALIASVAAGNMANGEPLSDVDRARLALASRRLQSAVELVNG